MSFTVENLEKNMAKLTIEVPAEEFDAAIKNAYNKNKNKHIGIMMYSVTETLVHQTKRSNMNINFL